MTSFTIEIRYSDRAPESRSFTQPKVSIGRDGGDIALKDSQVSGRHAELHFDGQRVTFVDVGSTNGSFDPSGARIIAPKALGIGDWVRLGGATIALVNAGSDATAKGRTMMASAPNFGPPPGAPAFGAPPGAPPRPPGMPGAMPPGMPPAAARPPMPAAPPAMAPPPPMPPAAAPPPPAPPAAMAPPAAKPGAPAGGGRTMMFSPGQLPGMPPRPGAPPAPAPMASPPAPPAAMAPPPAPPRPPMPPAAPMGMGAQPPAPAFGGAPPAPGGFPPPAAAPSPFGAPAAAPAPAPSPFGAPPAAPAPAPSPFGAPAAAPAAAPSPFGAPAPAPAPAPSPFGAPAPAPSPFGAPAAAPSPFGAPAPAPAGMPPAAPAFGAPADPNAAAPAGMPPAAPDAANPAAVQAADPGAVQVAGAAPAPAADGGAAAAFGDLMAANTGAATEFTAGVPLNDGGFVTAIKAGVELAKPTLMSAAYLIGAPLIVPSAVRFLIGWIPVVGWLVSSLVALAGSLAMIVTMPAFFLVLYSAAAGNAIGWQAAVKSIMGRLVEVVINFFVASLLTIVTIGIMGCYLPGVFFIEGERMFAINFKCLAYFKADWKRIVLSALVASLVVMVPVSIAAYLVGFVFGILPFIGWYLGPNLALLLTTAGIAVMIPIAAATLINLHLQTRAAQGSDVAAELRAMLEQWGVTNAG